MRFSALLILKIMGLFWLIEGIVILFINNYNPCPLGFSSSGCPFPFSLISLPFFFMHGDPFIYMRNTFHFENFLENVVIDSDWENNQLVYWYTITIAFIYITTALLAFKKFRIGIGLALVVMMLNIFGRIISIVARSGGTSFIFFINYPSRRPDILDLTILGFYVITLALVIYAFLAQPVVSNSKVTQV